MIEPAYTYRATTVSVYDGDTATFDVDLGMFVHLFHVTVRLLGINAPELVKGELPGIEARDYLRALLPVGSPVVIQTHRDRREKFGRWLATVYTADGVDVNADMVASGHAVPYML